MSIVHRMAGAALYLGTLLLVWWLIAMAEAPTSCMSNRGRANIPLAQFLIASVVALAGADYATAVGYVGGPLVVVVPLLLLVLSGSWHVRIGMQAIFKACVHDNLL